MPVRHDIFCVLPLIVSSFCPVLVRLAAMTDLTQQLKIAFIVGALIAKSDHVINVPNLARSDLSAAVFALATAGGEKLRPRPR